ncbi:DUF2326 domain-containing protein [Pseudoalteromonas sp. SWXJZ10B]|uniref:DUF2326 domain-containing protein n=1 Tax=Pseudoalteromonas sp. SWXJZ10B TaxID=2792063 RepID=UPI0018CF399E|nr:DUF2326 domain-containing protein [Pseudoalteromonas sp. SWXJZ10B]MBH0040848.1 DUF2326 domain-containing protein [Pseudoalteromonas sp. SWXJZ10B]
MFLKSLTIESEGHTIRKINFHKGINFIVDETKSSEGSDKQSGNNIGKTTVIRLINFCLGGSDKGIYQSKEFKNNLNEEVKAFLINNSVVITLRLRDDLDDPFSRQIEIRRNFLSNSKKILEINEKTVKVKDLDSELKKLIFGYEEDKPTFKQLKAKNIRDEAERLENTVRVLGNFGKAEEYEALYLFWLGVNYPSAEKKRSLLEEKRIEDTLYKRLISDNSESKIQQFLNIVERDIEQLERKKYNFNINEDYESDLESLNEVRARLNLLYAKQSQLSLRKELIEESKIELERDIANGEISQIAELYSQAKVIIPSLQKSYEDIVAFHNQMISEKIHYVTEELPSLQEQLIKTVSDIQLNLSKEQQFVDSLQKADAVDELQVIITELNGMYEQKGRLEEKSEQLQKTKATLSKIEKDLSVIDASIFSLNDIIQERVSSFNGFFSDISQRLYGEKFAMSATFEKARNSESSFYKLYIDSLNGQTGTGKKKGEIAAFDIAYVKFSDKEHIPNLHFILHDQMEVVDDNQIIGLVREVIDANCQFVVPILRDKLPDELDKPEYRVLSLSQNNKLFKI